MKDIPDMPLPCPEYAQAGDQIRAEDDEVITIQCVECLAETVIDFRKISEPGNIVCSGCKILIGYYKREVDGI